PSQPSSHRSGRHPARISQTTTTDPTQALAGERPDITRSSSVAPDDVVRGAALDRLDAARAEAQEALARYNQAWVQASRTGAEPLFCEPEIVAARELYDDAGSRCLPEAMWFAPYADDIRMSPQLPFALLFLEWEARYPQERQVHAKAWGTKQALIRRVAVGGRSDVITEKLIDLVELVVQRAYRWGPRVRAGGPSC
ncbi:hypothetical protein ABZS68_22745, partial [Streptomyces sp. NPDC005571]